MSIVLPTKSFHQSDSPASTAVSFDSGSMRALIYRDWHTLEVGDWPRPEVAPDGVILRVAACGICGSELEAIRKKSPRRTPPLVLGHEFCGHIVAVGSQVSGWKTGDAVVSNSVVSCGQCVRCVRGDSHICDQRQVFGMGDGQGAGGPSPLYGALAQEVAVPTRCLLHWPRDLAPEAACLAEPLANGVHMVNLSQHLRAETVWIIGAGPIGLLAGQAFRALRGSKVWFSDLSPERLQIAKEIGAQGCFNSAETDPVREILAVTEGEGVDLVIDAVGAGSTKKQSLEGVRAGGAAIWIGLHGDEMCFSSFGITLPEKTVIGSYAATQSEMEVAIELLQKSQIETRSWVETFPLERAQEAMRRMLEAKGNDIKAVICP